jgi:hypothetical protein
MLEKYKGSGRVDISHPELEIYGDSTIRHLPTVSISDFSFCIS